MKDELKQHFYSEQLTKCPPPEYKKQFFEVEKVLKRKKVKGENYFFVKYLYYPSKFNQWIPEKNFK